jgi:hypothetical protein
MGGLICTGRPSEGSAFAGGAAMASSAATEGIDSCALENRARADFEALVVAQLIELVKNDKLEIGPAMNKVIEDARKQAEAQQQAQGGMAPPGGPPPGPLAGTPRSPARC